MATIQYTIRGVTPQVDSRLRRLARLRGQSLNQVLLGQLMTQPSASTKSVSHSRNPVVNSDFDDLFGTMTPLEPEVEAAFRAQRAVNPKDW